MMCLNCIHVHLIFLVENSYLVLRKFLLLTKVPCDLDTDTLSGSESGSCLYLKDFLPYLLISLSD